MIIIFEYSESLLPNHHDAVDKPDQNAAGREHHGQGPKCDVVRLEPVGVLAVECERNEELGKGLSELLKELSGGDFVV